MAGEVLVAHAGHGDRADARDVDHAVAVDHRAEVDVDLAPGAHEELVARANYVVAGDRDVLDGRESSRRFKQVEAEDRQLLAGRGGDEFLEFVALGGRQLGGGLRRGLRLLLPLQLLLELLELLDLLLGRRYGIGDDRRLGRGDR